MLVSGGIITIPRLKGIQKERAGGNSDKLNSGEDTTTQKVLAAREGYKGKKNLDFALFSPNHQPVFLPHWLNLMGSQGQRGPLQCYKTVILQGIRKWYRKMQRSMWKRSHPTLHLGLKHRGKPCHAGALDCILPQKSLHKPAHPLMVEDEEIK